jgi:RNase P/RNase MRP subunit POP5
MGTYNFSARELANEIRDFLENLEGDFTLAELEKALRLVAVEQRVQADDACAVCGKTHREHVVINLGHVFVIPHRR